MYSGEKMSYNVFMSMHERTEKWLRYLQLPKERYEEFCEKLSDVLTKSDEKSMSLACWVAKKEICVYPPYEKKR